MCLGVVQLLYFGAAGRGSRGPLEGLVGDARGGFGAGDGLCLRRLASPEVQSSQRLWC